MFRAKDKSPYEDDRMQEVFLNPSARVTADQKTKKYTYPKKLDTGALKKDAKAQETQKMLESITQASASANTKVGVDVERIDAINVENDTFIERNFTAQEIAYCQKAASPQSSFAGKWSAKEAVFKSLGVQGQGAGAALKDIEIVNDENGAPTVKVRHFHT
jgi:fatty acid synthase subunit alpha